MSTYRLYQEARNAAWRTLEHFACCELPVSPLAIAEKLRISVLPFPDSNGEPKLYALVKRNPHAVCVSLSIENVWHIFLQKDLPPEYAAFAVAHELGHIILHHGTVSPAPKTRAFTAWENEGDILDDPQDMEDYAADIFAVRLLAPACVLHEMHVDSPERIAQLCCLPRKAASLRGERMELLNQRDVFYADPLEKRVMRQFLPYIRSQNVMNTTPHIVPMIGIVPDPVQTTETLPNASHHTAVAEDERAFDSGDDSMHAVNAKDNNAKLPIKRLCILLAIIAAVFLILVGCGVFSR